MNKKILMFASTIAFFGGFLLFYRGGPMEQAITSAEQPYVEGASADQRWTQKIDEQSSVAVLITPINISRQSKEWKFDISMNTHSFELEQDITKIVVLLDDFGKEYKPIKWVGPTGGHHKKGILIFDPINPWPKSIKLKISDIGDVVRYFVW